MSQYMLCVKLVLSAHEHQGAVTMHKDERQQSFGHAMHMQEQSMHKQLDLFQAASGA